jgi:hypothetical protein
VRLSYESARRVLEQQRGTTQEPDAQRETREQYDEAISIAERILETLKQERSQVGSETTWADHGSAQFHRFKLKQISDALHSEGEYAE